jgi:hypothetical protein
MESQETFNNFISYNILSFPTAIYTPSYDQRFRSYRFWKLTELLKFDSGQNEVTWVIQILGHLQSENLVNIENQTHSYSLKFPTHPYTAYSGKPNQGYHNLKTVRKHGSQ